MNPLNRAVLDPFKVVAGAVDRGQMLHITPPFLDELMTQARRDEARLLLDLAGQVVPITRAGKVVGYMLKSAAEEVAAPQTPYSVGFTVGDPPK